MGGNRNMTNFTVHSRSDGRRDFYQHDDRGYSDRPDRNFSGHSSRQNFSARGGQFQNNSNSYVHGGRRGQNYYRGGGSKRFVENEDMPMGEKRPHKYQQMYENSRGRRDRRGRGKPFYTSCGWQRVLIKNCSQFSKDEILSAIKSLVDDDFTPISMAPEGNNYVFFLENNYSVAKAITGLSGRITIGTNFKLYASFSEAFPPVKKLTTEQKEILKTVMSNRYSIEMNRLDLKHFHNDKVLLSNSIFCPLFKQPTATSIMKIILENIPLVEEIDLSQNCLLSCNELGSLKSCTKLKRLYFEKNRIRFMDNMSKLKGLLISEITLDGNPLTEKYPEQESYISAVKKLFPKVEKLDGKDLSKTAAAYFEVEDNVPIPTTKPSFFCSDEVRGIIVQFVEQYYQVFESDDRKTLEAAYTEDAMLSISASFPESGLRSALWIERKNRNLKRITSSSKKQSLLYKGRTEVIETLCDLPKLCHDPASFVIDIPIARPCLIHVILRGVFKQVYGKPLRIQNFMKSMIIIPVGAGLCIANEELHFNNASVEQTMMAFEKPATPEPTTTTAADAAAAVVPQPSAATEDPLAGLNPAQLELMKQFALNSKMLPQYCRMCLERNEWDFTKAGEMFVNLINEKKIPQEYFGAPT